MIALIDRFEQMGRRGGPPALALAGFLVLVAAVMLGASFLFELPSRWAEGALRGIGIFAAVMGVVYGMVGARLLTARIYPPAEEVFPSLPPDDFVQVVRTGERPMCVCTRCRIFLPAHFSTGACPRCASSVDYYEIASDDDADMVLLAVRG